jgi:hypothetical protein
MPVQPRRGIVVEWFVLFRGVERWLIVLAAMLCLWLSTRVPRGTERSQGKFKWGGYLIELKNIGPNVFFAGFGAFILIVSLFAKLDSQFYQSYSNSQGAAENAKGSATEVERRTNYLTPPVQTRQKASTVAREIAVLQTYASSLAGNALTQDERQALLASMRRLASSQAGLFEIAFGEGSRSRFDDYESKCSGDPVASQQQCQQYRSEFGASTLSEMEKFGK